MELMRLINHINDVTDEDFEVLQVIGFMNDAIAKINIEAGAKYPFIEDDLPEVSMYEFEEYEALPDTWIRSLIVPYAAGRIKENDSSQFEYVDWYRQFDANIDLFKQKYQIPVQYVDENAIGRRFTEDYSTNMFSPTRGW